MEAATFLFLDLKTRLVLSRTVGFGSIGPIEMTVPLSEEEALSEGAAARDGEDILDTPDE